MARSAPVDGFSLAYDRMGSGPPVLLLHGWPGDRTDFRALVPLLTDAADVVVPDLRVGSGSPTSTRSTRARATPQQRKLAAWSDSSRSSASTPW